MKLTKYIAIYLLFIAFFLTGCAGKNAKELIVNKWRLTQLSGESAREMSDSAKKEMTDKFLMELTKDGKVTMSGIWETPKTGTYSLSEDGKTLFLIQEGSAKAEPQIINELKEGKLVFTSEKDKLTLSFSAK